MKSILIAAYGTPGVFGLEHLLALGYLPDQLAVLTHPEDARNAPLFAFAAAHGIEICDGGCADPVTIAFVKRRAPEAIFSLHYRDRIPQSILGLAKLGGVNLHPSLLPKHRGCFSAPWAIIEGDTTTGFTYHTMTDKFDEGTILLQHELPISDTDTAYSLFHREIIEGMKVFPEVVWKTLAGDKGEPQKKDGGSYHTRSVPFDGIINPDWDRAQVDRFIRAMIFPPFKPAMLNVDGKLEPVTSLADFDRLTSRA